ncbi:MAG: 23S rRNA (adenine(2030)-N(6))-methyltransferase RlmJ [Alphaproteobacteria bacterium]|nr:23S rRNA (adenine(2030)-N(6))-methyltransferase RlmJ [Alphaproteobacteria bacterium]
MLSYRHGFHAGNHADVLKHATFVFVADYLQQKPSPLLFLDTHAGAGQYDLDAPEARKTGEFQQGISLIYGDRAEAPTLLRHFLGMVGDVNAGGPLDTYPGSPQLAARLRRQQDRVLLHELHSTDYGRLESLASAQEKVHAEKADGLQGLIARVPPPEKRGLILIDPSYEMKTDYAIVTAALARAWKKFPTGVYILWYPVIDRSRVHAMEVALRAARLRSVFRLELCMTGDTAERGMTGSGLFVVNPPYVLPDAAREGLPWLAARLGAEGPWTADWLIPE